MTPLIAKGITRVPEQVLTFWHDTLLFVFPPGATFSLTYRPRQGQVYLVFGMTLGHPRDFVTGDVLTTDDFGFWHRHGQMRWHWDPAVESIYETDYPHWLEVSDTDPAELAFYNNTARTVIVDVSIWIFECSQENWDGVVVPYLKAIYEGRLKGKEAATVGA